MKSQLPINYRHNLKMLIFTVSFFLCFNAVLAQQFKDRDSMANLWIVTFDKSGSMTKYGSITENTKKTIKNLRPFYEKIKFRKDRFSFYNTGILLESRIADLRYVDRFEQSFIHEKNGKDRKPLHTLVTFRSPERLNTYISEKLEIPKNEDYSDYYKYRYSFVSLIRPIVLSRVIESLNSNQSTEPPEGFLNFNKIYILSITDDADIDDQWQKDYKNVSKYAPRQLKRVNETLNRLVISPFNVSSKPVAKFEEVLTKDANWKIFLHEYKTYASVDDTLTNTSYLTSNQLNDSIISIQYNVDYIDSCKVEFCELNKILLNGEKLESDRYFNQLGSIKFSELRNSGENNLVLEGAFQVSYVDSILGKRYKKFYFQENLSFLSNDRIASIQGRKKFVGAIIAGAVILGLLWFLFYRPRQVLFEVYDNLGNHVTVKKGFPFGFKPHQKRNLYPQPINYIGAYPRTLKNIGLEPEKIIFSPFNFIKRESIRIPGKSHNGELILYLKSKHKLAVGSVPSAIASEGMNEYSGANYDKLTSGGRGDAILSNIISNTDSASKYNFYRIPTRRNKHLSNENQRIEVKLKSEGKKVFIFSFSGKETKEISNYTKNQKFIFSTINEHFKNGLQHNGLIILNQIDDDLYWNIVALNHNGSPNSASNPMDVYHFYEYKQRNVAHPDIEALKPMLDILSNESTNSKFLKIDKIATYMNIPGITKEGYLEVADPYTSYMEKSFRLTESKFKSFLYLIETKYDTEDAKKQQFYSPFTVEAGRRSFYRSSLLEGDYYLNSSPIPLEKIESSETKHSELTQKIYDSPITINHESDIEITFQKEKILFLNHEIKV